MSWYQPPLEGGLQDPPFDGIINPSEREEVVIVPLYGLIHDSPAITAIQKATRRGRRNGKANDFVEDTQWIDAAMIRFLKKAMHKIDNMQAKQVEEDKKN